MYQRLHKKKEGERAGWGNTHGLARAHYSTVIYLDKQTMLFSSVLLVCYISLLYHHPYIKSGVQKKKKEYLSSNCNY